MRVLGIVTARGGSKGVPGKNIRPLRGKPLLAWTAEAALGATRLARTILTTDDPAIAEVGRACGLNVPFLRPAELATDAAATLPVLQHAVAHLEAAGERFDAICLLQPTHPFRAPSLIDACVDRFVASGADSLVTVLPVPTEHNPHWVYFADAAGDLHLATGEREPIPQRQALPPAFHREGSVYIMRRDVLVGGPVRRACRRPRRQRRRPRRHRHARRLGTRRGAAREARLMCGIVAVAGDPDARGRVVRALPTLHHRGPDASGTWCADGIALGHTRLSIIDLSDAGRQPMTSADGRYTITFNGEVYNYVELRAELGDYPFRSQSDTEVVLAAWARWGEACLDRLLGMFAFAIWDCETRELVAVRDRFGVKPLYVAALADGGIALASEIKTLRAAGADTTQIPPRGRPISQLEHSTAREHSGPASTRCRPEACCAGATVRTRYAAGTTSRRASVTTRRSSDRRREARVSRASRRKRPVALSIRRPSRNQLVGWCRLVDLAWPRPRRAGCTKLRRGLHVRDRGRSLRRNTVGHRDARTHAASACHELADARRRARPGRANRCCARRTVRRTADSRVCSAVRVRP